MERVGDWVCIKCKNLNFSFRVICNRCQLAKAESDKMFDTYMNNLVTYMKVNDIHKENVNNGHNYGQVPNTYIRPNNLINNNSININNNYYSNIPNQGLFKLENNANPYKVFDGIGNKNYEKLMNLNP